MICISASDRDHIISDIMPDLTPLLDVMFMLIVFLILTANAVPYALDIDLPRDNRQVTQAVSDNDVLSITILSGSESWKINQKHYSAKSTFFADLKQRYKTNEEQRVIILGEKTVTMQRLMDLLAFLRKEGIPAADIVMER